MSETAQRYELDPYLFMPPILAPCWVQVQDPRINPMHLAYRDKVRGLWVIYSVSVERDGKTWIHVSVSHPHQMPTWEQLVSVKEDFLGAEAQALQILPKRSEWVNIHLYCLHLWCCADADGDGLPDFRDAEPLLGGKLGI